MDLPVNSLHHLLHKFYKQQEQLIVTPLSAAVWPWRSAEPICQHRGRLNHTANTVWLKTFGLLR